MGAQRGGRAFKGGRLGSRRAGRAGDPRRGLRSRCCSCAEAGETGLTVGPAGQ